MSDRGGKSSGLGLFTCYVCGHGPLAAPIYSCFRRPAKEIYTMDTHTLLCPFLNDEPAFAHCVEFGMLYARLRDERERAIEECFLIENQEQITLAANRLGWRIVRMCPWTK